RLAEGALPAEEALRVCRQIAEGLNAAHRKGITHRDIKPANIKVTPDGDVKVLDFGLAKPLAGFDAQAYSSCAPTLDTVTQSGMFVGTPAYVSPEQLCGSVVDQRTDIWSFGCVMYEVLVGNRAFTGSSFAEIAASVLKSEPDWDALPEGI